MLLSAVSVLVLAQSSSEIPEGLMNNPVYWNVPTMHRTLNVMLVHIPLTRMLLNKQFVYRHFIHLLHSFCLQVCN